MKIRNLYFQVTYLVAFFLSTGLRLETKNSFNITRPDMIYCERGGRLWVVRSNIPVESFIPKYDAVFSSIFRILIESFFYQTTVQETAILNQRVPCKPTGECPVGV